MTKCDKLFRRDVMEVWWNGLTTMEQILYCIAIPSTLILLLQTILIFCGFDHDGGMNVSDTSGIDFDMDVSHDISFDSDVSDINIGDTSPVSDVGSMHFFTVQGVVAFLCIFGWSSIIILHGSGKSSLAIVIGMVFGIGAMFLVAKILQLSSRMTQSGTLNLHNALGEVGRVYLTVPAKGEGTGKVNITVQGSFLEFDALNNTEEPIKTGEAVRVIDIEGDCIIVEKE